MKKEKISKSLIRGVLILNTLLVVVPIGWVVTTSFKTSTEFLSNPWALPSQWKWENYYKAFVRANVELFFANSIVITLGSMGILFVLIVPAAYALSRFKFKFSKIILMAFMMGIFINATYIIVPLFMVLRNLKLLDSHIGLVMVYVGTTLPFNIYLLTGFMKGIPKEYEEAAWLEGCGYWKTLVKIIIPMSKPGMGIVSMFAFMSYWNEYALGLTFIATESKRTLPVGLKNLMEIQKYATDWGAMFAGLVIVMLPTLVFYMLVQKVIISGISIGGIKE